MGTGGVALTSPALPGLAATAKPTSAGGVPSRKKGLCCVTKDAKGWEQLQSVRARWFYNWSTQIPEGRPEAIEFIPMIWGGGNSIRQTCRQLKEQGHKQVLGFNEPDQHDQSNLTVEQALAAWPALMESGLRLGSPGCVHPDRDWMKSFMAQAKARSYRIDFISMHWYWEPRPEAFLGRVEGVHKLFGLPIWITEFAVADWDAGAKKPNRFSRNQVLRFMQRVLPALEKTSYVERYCWFPASADDLHLGPSALFDKDRSLTKPGQYYASL